MASARNDFDSLPWQSAATGARCKLYRDGAKQIRLVEFSAEFVEREWCKRGHSGFVLEGTLEITFNDGIVVYPRGSGISIPAGDAAPHKARSLTPTVLLFLVEDAE